MESSSPSGWYISRQTMVFATIGAMTGMKNRIRIERGDP